MTETAKQGTNQAKAGAQAAAKEPAAQPDTQAQPDKAATPAAAAPAGTAPPEAKGAAGGEAAETPDAAQPDLDETKRKFREALERKHQVHNDGQERGGRDGAKINGAHGPAASRRNFRRKSG
jgi:Family of unknown function (DUF5302)